MILVDVNLLLYAYDSTSRFHEQAKPWWEHTLSQPAPVGLPWATLLAFLRIATNPRVLTSPMDIAEASEHVESWIARPMVHIVQPTERHWEILQDLLVSTRSRANHVPDAHLAALAIEHGATLQTTDRDFARFPNLAWNNPLD
jgi:hypothetical protein